MTDLMVRPGPRARTTRRRRRRFRRAFTRTLVIGVVAGAVALAGFTLARRTADVPPPALGIPTDGEQIAILVATTAAADPSQRAEALTIFAVDRSGEDPVAMFVPTATYGQIPGQSSIEQIGKALTLGRESLQQTTVENLLGVRLDRTIMIDDVMLARLVQALGGIEVEVTEGIYETDPTGRRELVFPLGVTPMEGARAVTYLTYRGADETELDGFSRAQRFWEGVLNAVADAGSANTALAELEGLDDGDARALGEVLDAFALAPEERAFDVLAVESVGAGAEAGAYDLDPTEADAQIRTMFGGSLPPLVRERGIRPRVELRNGVGLPEVGATAAALLVPDGFKIEVTGNTAAFGNSSTRIIVYGEDEASLALAERARALLGVGGIEVGTRGQTVVNLTIVIGRDFVRKV